MRLVRSLTAERAERIRSQERAEMAAHLHDSVLQTLALVQKRSDDPRAVASLARRQERELRAWLSGRAGHRTADGERRLASALELAAEEVEDAHGVPIEVVAVGDLALDEAGEAIVAAAREAMQNAAKFGGGAPVDVYAEVERRARAGVRPRPRPGLRPGGDARRPPRRARVDRRPHEPPRRDGRDPQPAGRGHRGRADRRAPAFRGAADMSAGDAPRVVIVDDHALFRAGVRSELQQHVPIAGEAATVDDAVALIEAERPDVVLLDVHMPDGGGVEVIRRVAQRGDDAQPPCFLALSVSDAAEDVIAVIRAGARGYVTKTISAEELADAIRRVHDGDAVFSPRLAGFVLDAFAGAPPPAPADDVRPRSAHRPRARGPPADRPRLHVQGDRAPPGRSRRRPSRRTCRRCCASSSSRAATS